MEQNQMDLSKFREKLEEMARDLSVEPDIALHLGEPPENHEQTEHQIDFALKDMATGRYRQILEALQRIENGSYGMCGDCGRRIDWERLEIIPEATCCVECQRTREHQAEFDIGLFGLENDPPDFL